MFDTNHGSQKRVTPLTFLLIPKLMSTRICITLCIHEIKSFKLLSQVNPITAAFYDSILMYGLALNETLNNNEDPRDGRVLARKLLNKTYYNGNDYHDVN